MRSCIFTQMEQLFTIFSFLTVALIVFPQSVVKCQDIIFVETESETKDKDKNSRLTYLTGSPPTLSTHHRCETLCVTLDFCSHLFQLLQEPNVKNMEILRKASCGFTPDGDPLVLCEDFLCDSRAGKLTTTSANISTTISPQTAAETKPTAAAGFDNNMLRSRLFNALDNDDCGVAFPSRINGGQSASWGEFPWIVGIALHMQSTAGPQIICGGALVGFNWVLTAAHCVADSGHRVRNISHVRVGAFNISDPNEEGAEDIEVAKVLFHDQFRERPIVRHDIALLKLKRNATPGLNVASICLPTSTNEEVYYDPKSIGTIAGWGSDGAQAAYSILQKVDIPLVPGDHCKRLFYRVRVRVLPELQVCAGATGKDSCKGDSGGPLMTIINGRTVLTGIISYGTVQCDGRLPGVYTKVTSYLDWINEVVTKNS